jgi:hypothetical protein
MGIGYFTTFHYGHRGITAVECRLYRAREEIAR